jgi:hypothetical protein
MNQQINMLQRFVEGVGWSCPSGAGRFYQFFQPFLV